LRKSVSPLFLVFSTLVDTQKHLRPTADAFVFKTFFRSSFDSRVIEGRVRSKTFCLVVNRSRSKSDKKKSLSALFLETSEEGLSDVNSFVSCKGRSGRGKISSSFVVGGRSILRSKLLHQLILIESHGPQDSSLPSIVIALIILTHETQALLTWIAL
jgi:hypothetical protein